MKFDSIGDNILILENYTENYIPLQMMNIMLDSLRLCLHEDQINVLRSEENKMYHTLKK